MRSGTAWVYAVVSSAKQDGTIDDQLAWARRVASEHGWEIIREFQGVSSGRDGTRRLLDELLAELRAAPRAARPERVLMIRIDRLGRGDGLDAIVAMAEIRKLGVTIHTRQDGDVKIERATDALVPALRSITGALENEARSEKSREMHARKRAAGEVQGLPPYGFIVVDRRLHPYEPEAAYLRELFALRARGASYAKLATHARQHAPSKRRKNGDMKAVRWHTTTLTKMLSNPVYRGAIIPEDLFDDVVSMRKGPIARQDAKNPWPLRGALRCVCGLAVTGRTSGAGKYRQRYYVCVDVAAHGGYPGHNALAIEAQFADLLRRIVADPALLATYKDRTVDLDGLRSRKHALEREREALATRRARVWDLVEEERIPRDEIAGRLEELRAKSDRVAQSIAELDREMARAESAARMWGGASDALAVAAETWLEADVAMRQEIAQAVGSLIGGLWVDPSQKNRLLVSHGKLVHKAETVCRETTYGGPHHALLALAAIFDR